MANRYPLVVDTTNGNKIRELPSGDSLQLTGNNIIGVVGITASGTIGANEINATSIKKGGVELANVAVTGAFADLTGSPTQLSDLTDDLNVLVPGDNVGTLTNNVGYLTTVAFADLTAKPTTIAGYGITDAATSAQGGLAATAVQPGASVSVLVNDAGYLTLADIQNGAVTIDVNNTGDLVGSVFADDSTILIDSILAAVNLDGTIRGHVRPNANQHNLWDLGTDAVRFKNAYFAGTINGAHVGTLDGDVTGSVFGDDSTLLVDGVNGTLNATTLTGALPAIDGSALTNLTIPAQTFASLTGKPTTVAGYGIADAYTKTEVDSAITSSVLPSGSTQSIDVVAQDSTVLVDSVNGTLNATTLTGALPAIDGSALTGVTTAFSNITSIPTTLAGYGITDAFDGVFASLTSKPTTIAGYGITDAFDGVFASLTSKPTTIAGYGITDALALGTSSTTALAGDTALFDGAFASLTSKPTTIAGYGITDALSSGGNITLGGDLDVGGNSIVSASNGPINIAPNGSGAIELNGQVKFDEGMIEKFATTNGATGVTALDCSTGNIHYLTAPAGDITANFTNLGLTAEYATNVTIIINQGATPYEVTAVQIGEAAQTIEWQGGSAPTGNANGIDSFSFTILNDGGTYVVLGQMVDFT